MKRYMITVGVNATDALAAASTSNEVVAALIAALQDGSLAPTAVSATYVECDVVEGAAGETAAIAEELDVLLLEPSGIRILSKAGYLTVPRGTAH